MNTDSIEGWLRRHCGLEAGSLGPGAVARAVLERCAKLGCAGPADYLGLLTGSAAEQQELIERVVVGETWFFRHRAAIDAVARHAVETWGPAHPGAVFRVLCVPCSTGEEPYSLAMAFALAGWPADRLLIEALDISRENVARARTGIYRRNSFRGEDLSFRDRFLEAAGPDAWRVADAIRGPVAFAEANLLADDFAVGRGFYEAVFCRNLLIYFDRPVQDQVIATLDGLLAPGGFFAVGPAEPVLLFAHGYSALQIPGAFLLQRSPPRLTTPAPFLALPRPRPALLPPPAPAVAKTSPKPVSPPPPPVPAGVPARPPDTLAAVQALADAGKLAEAAARGRELLARGASPELLYLLGVIADAAGEPGRAEEFYRKTLYLAPQHLGALAQLALQAEKRGDLRAARALRARAARVADKEAPVA